MSETQQLQRQTIANFGEPWQAFSTICARHRHSFSWTIRGTRPLEMSGCREG